MTKLFNQVRPDVAIFGEKDYQQLAVIRQMVADLDLGIEIIGLPTQRAQDGLALSSRNAYLNDEERKAALALPRALGEAKRQMEKGGSVEEALTRAGATLIAQGFDPVDYVMLCDAVTLEPILAHPELSDGWSDIELFMTAAAMNENPAIPLAFGLKRDLYEDFYADIIKNRRNAFMIFPMILRPKSRGRIKLKSSNPFKYPLIYPNYFTHPYDMDVAVGGLQKIMNLTRTPAFRAINAEVLKKKLPGCKQFEPESYDYLACYARHFTMTIYHYVGTAKMGPKSDRTAVVDERLRVHGIRQLRVVDGSIMPEIISGHPNGPIYMIAEKAADMIKQDYNFI